MRKKTTVDGVQFISKYLTYTSTPTLYPENNRARQELILSWLERYHTPDVSKEERDLLVELVVLNTWYLFPYILSNKRMPLRIFEDALQNMVIATMRAIDNFNPFAMSKLRPGTRALFRSYVAKYLQDAVATSCRQDSLVPRPSNMRLKVVVPEGTVDLAPVEPIEQDAAEGFKSEHNTTRVGLARHVDAENLPSVDNVEHQIYKAEIITALEQVLDQNAKLLTPQEREVLVYRYGIFGAPRLTLEQIAAMFKTRGTSYTKVWVHQLEKRALRKLRKYFVRTMKVSSSCMDV